MEQQDLLVQQDIFQVVVEELVITLVVQAELEDQVVEVQVMTEVQVQVVVLIQALLTLVEQEVVEALLLLPVLVVHIFQVVMVVKE